MSKKKRSTDDFADEIQSHIELEADELEREGLSQGAARQKGEEPIRQLEFGPRTVLSPWPGSVAR
jgi:hypothetical protein